MRKRFLLIGALVFALSSCADLAANIAASNPESPEGQARLRAKLAEMHANEARIDPSIPKTLIGTIDENGRPVMKPGYELTKETVIEQDENGYLRADDDHLVVTYKGRRITD
jgi:hypothetical protein